MKEKVGSIDHFGEEKCASEAVLRKFAWELISGIYTVRRLLVREQDLLGNLIKSLSEGTFATHWMG